MWFLFRKAAFLIADCGTMKFLGKPKWSKTPDIHSDIKKENWRFIFNSPLVALERLELSQTEPESGVLPLHHKARFLFTVLGCSLLTVQNYYFLLIPPNFQHKKITFSQYFFCGTKLYFEYQWFRPCLSKNYGGWGRRIAADLVFWRRSSLTAVTDEEARRCRDSAMGR